jgi:hypothetical protein
MKYSTITANEIVYLYSQIMVWELPELFYHVEFKDTSVIMHRNQIIGSWYYWQVFRYYPEVEIFSASAITEFYKKSTHMEILGFILWSIYNQLEVTHSVDVWDLSGVVYEVSNLISNTTQVELTEYMSLGSIYDITEILYHPAVIAAKQKFKDVLAESNYNEIAVAKAISTMDKEIYKVVYENPKILPNNQIKRMAMLGLLNKNQFAQLVGVRGYCKDIDDRVFPYPVEHGYAEGLSDLYEITIESRDAALSKLMQTSPLEKSEYFNRKSQVCAASLTKCLPKPPFQKLQDGGCTGFITVPMLVEQVELESFLGKFHMVDNKPELLWYDNIKNYEGKVVQMRSISGCGSLNPQHVCHICLGWTSLIQPPDMNLGYKISSESGKIQTSSILGTKHLTKSSISEEIQLDTHTSKWLYMKSRDDVYLYLHPRDKEEIITIKVKTQFVKFLNQIQHIGIGDLTPSAITKIPLFTISSSDRTGEKMYKTDTLKLEVGGIGVSLSTEALAFIKKNGYNNGKNFVEIKFKGWDYTKPFLITPRKGENVMNLFNSIRSFLEGGETKDGTYRITDCVSRAQALTEFNEIMKGGLKLGASYNITHLEVFVKALMVRENDFTNSYDMPKPHEQIKFSTTLKVAGNRSLGGMFGLQTQHELMRNVHFLNPKPNTEHMFDYLLGSVAE